MKEKIINAQKKWADGIIRMGELSNDRTSLEDYTNNFLEEMIFPRKLINYFIPTF